MKFFAYTCVGCGYLHITPAENPVCPICENPLTKIDEEVEMPKEQPNTPDASLVATLRVNNLCIKDLQARVKRLEICSNMILEKLEK